MKTKRFINIYNLTTLLLTLFISTFIFAAEKPADDTIVYNNGGKRVHVKNCKRLSKDPKELAKMTKLTLAEAKKKNLDLCSRCPGSKTAGKDNGVKGDTAKQGKKGKNPETWVKASPTKSTEASIPKKKYDLNTTVYCDALWMRVHTADCPALILKEKKKTMTLEEADKAGWRIGESGQSGRENCCLLGYKRKNPLKGLSDDCILFGNDLTRNVKHQAGCHRTQITSGSMRKTKKEWKAKGFKVCDHCIERGPSLTTISMDRLKALPDPKEFVAPEGWVPKPFSPDKLPSKEEIEILIQETLAQGYGIQELPYDDPLASLEQFMGMRFFFPIGNWLSFYQAYRATGDKRLLEALRVSARHYTKLSLDYPNVAQLKARNPEHMAFMYSMAVSSRLTLQLARKHPDQVSQKEIAEAEASLKAMISVLKPVCQGNSPLDAQMGIPQKLADDFRSQPSNRAMNGIGTIAMATAALKDLQVLKKTKEYQSTIDRYHKVVGEYIKHFKDNGHLCTKIEGKPMFIYPYGQEPSPKIVEGCKIFGRPEDGGHYTHCLQGMMLLYDATPELGIDNDFMTAIANAVYYNATEARKKLGKKVAGLIQCPIGYRVHKKSMKGKNFGPRDRFYMLEAFRPGTIDGQYASYSEQKKAAANSQYAERLKTLHAQYLKANHKDPSLIHLGEEK